MRAGAALLFLFVAVPFDSLWPDFETARRGLLLIAAAVLAATGPRWCRTPWPRGGGVLAALCATYLVRSIGVTNPAEGLLRAAHWTALAVLFFWGASGTPDRVARGFLWAAALIVAYGLLQVAGLDWPAGYAVATAERAALPLSTLGNANVASEVAALGAAACAVTVATAPRPTASIVLLGATALYLGVNGSRSGLLALVVVVPVVLLGVRREHAARRWLALLAAVALCGAGSLLGPDRSPLAAAERTGSAAATPAEAGGDRSELERPAAPSTVEVRLEIWSACAAMIGDAPLFGHGSGQFRYEYPRYRNQREIELSSFGRRFATFVETAHDDPLEIAVETGAVGLVLWLWWLSAVAWPHLRSRRGLALLAPLLAFVALSLVRSPLGNAPAAAFAFAYMGALTRVGPDTSVRAVRARPPRQRAGVLGKLAAIGFGIVLACAGLELWIGQEQGAEYVRAVRQGAPSVELVEPVERAVAWHGSEPRLRSLLVRARRAALGPGRAYGASTDDLRTLAEIDPHNTESLLLTTELALAAGQLAVAKVAASRVLALDPREPRAALRLAEILCLEGAVERAVGALYADPHPRLREGLAAHLDGLSKLRALQQNPRGQALLMREAAFVRALDAVLADAAGEPTRQAAQRATRMLGEATHRVAVLRAAILQARGETDAADRLAPAALELTGAIRRLCAPLLDRLRELPRWRGIVDSG